MSGYGSSLNRKNCLLNLVVAHKQLSIRNRLNFRNAHFSLKSIKKADRLLRSIDKGLRDL